MTVSKRLAAMTLSLMLLGGPAAVAAQTGDKPPPAGTTGAPVDATDKPGPVAGAGEIDVSRQIMDLRRQLQGAVARKDRAALAALYHDRFTHLRETGRADTKKARLDLLLSGQNGIELASTDQALLEVYSPDAAVLSGVSVVREKSRKRGENFQWMTLYVRDNGQWRVAFSQANRVPKPE